SKQAQQLMTDLQRQYGARIFPADYTTALKKMHGAAVLKAPSKAAASLVAEMTVQLANAGFPSLASQYMETFVTMSHHNNIVESICDSLAFGVEDR
ncbi:MAG: hypothetical protein IJH04_09755, partial [Eggerthellaceae bacterium]|nr:hypothetical protein [Eggerthellaceae bacterium]